MGFFGPTSGVTLVSPPVNGYPAVLAYRRRQLAGIIVVKARRLIYDIHSTADPGRFGFASG